LFVSSEILQSRLLDFGPIGEMASLAKENLKSETNRNISLKNGPAARQKEICKAEGKWFVHFRLKVHVTGCYCRKNTAIKARIPRTETRRATRAASE